MLTAAAGVVDHLLLVDVLALTGPGGPAAAAEHALHTFARIGRAPRTADELRELARAAGWQPAGHTLLGWDHEAFEFRR